MTALAGLTLLECGVPADMPPYVWRPSARASQSTSNQRTYNLALALLFLDRLRQPEQDRELIGTIALRLIAGQTAAGGWSYNCPSLTPDAEKELLRLLASEAAKEVPGLVQAPPHPSPPVDGGERG